MAEIVGTETWVPTHRAPREGLDAWIGPDAAAEPSAELEARVEMQVVDTAGVWARVRCENGWEGWVDGRLLEQVGRAGERTGDMSAFVLLGIAVAVLIVLAALGLTSS